MKKIMSSAGNLKNQQSKFKETDFQIAKRKKYNIIR